LPFIPRIERPLSFQMILPSSLAFPLLERPPCWSKCGRRTRPFPKPSHRPRSYLSSPGSLIDPRMRASNEHLLSVRVPRPGGRLGCPSHPSQAARCASTRRSSASIPPLFREHRANMGVLPIFRLCGRGEEEGGSWLFPPLICEKLQTVYEPGAPGPLSVEALVATKMAGSRGFIPLRQ